jgi:hypothetical protein
MYDGYNHKRERRLARLEKRKWQNNGWPMPSPIAYWVEIGLAIGAGAFILGVTFFS